MTIPIFNSIYSKYEGNIKSKPLDINILNNLNLENVDKIRYPVIKIINQLPDKDSLYETVVVSANDKLVSRFLNNEIKFTDISTILIKFLKLSEFTKLKRIKPKNVKEISKLVDYVSLKINTISV
jgi:1-deoxy-D-xylulose-5-phosphate reductoisomerase